MSAVALIVIIDNYNAVRNLFIIMTRKVRPCVEILHTL